MERSQTWMLVYTLAVFNLGVGLGAILHKYGWIV